MHSRVAVLHAGLLARKGEARPASIADRGLAARSAPGFGAAVSLEGRREPIAGPSDGCDAPQPPRRIEFPPMARRIARQATARRNIHARLESDTHVRLKVAAARLGRTQQDIVASAVSAYLSLIEDNALSSVGSARDAGG